MNEYEKLAEQLGDMAVEMTGDDYRTIFDAKHTLLSQQAEIARLNARVAELEAGQIEPTVLVAWLAQTVTGARPACAASVQIGDNGRFKADAEYRLMISYEDENGEEGYVSVSPDVWQSALIWSMKAGAA